MTTTLEPATPTSAGDTEAERAVLAACLNTRDACPAARRTLTPEAFYRNDHRLIFEAMTALDERSQPTDPINVYGEMLHRDKIKRVDMAYIHTLYAYPFTGPSTAWAIRRIANLARQRERAALGVRMGQIAAEVEDPDDMADAMAKTLIELEVLIDDHSDDDTVPGLDKWDDFLAKPQRDTDAVIPGMLDRQEVVMILAAPGVGKSWLSRQVALTVAAGLHPFIADRPIPPRRTLLIDLENPETTVRRQVADPYFAIRHFAKIETVGDRGWIWTHTAGLNIRKRADAALFERVISDTRPDLVCIGSLYNLFHRGSSDWDTAAEETIAVLNRIRSRYGCALWIEHHMPRATEGGHRQSPFGSTLWERWPSYGRVIKRIAGDLYDFSVFRGDREAGREFPAGLKRGGKFAWSPIWDAGEMDLIREAATS